MEHCESNAEKKRLNKSLNRPENGNVLHENAIPQQTNQDCVNKNNNEEDEEDFEKVSCGFYVDKVANHLMYSNKKNKSTLNERPGEWG